MKIFLSFVGMFVILLSFSVGQAIHETIPAETFVPLPGPYAQSVYKYITVEDDYTKWSLWPGKGRQYKARSPLRYATTYVNDNARYSIRVGEKMANGSIIVTENYSPKKNLSAIFVMYKIDGYDPPSGDWFWAQYTPVGKVKSAGKVKACIECHTKEKANDYIFTEKFIK